MTTDKKYSGEYLSDRSRRQTVLIRFLPFINQTFLKAQDYVEFTRKLNEIASMYRDKKESYYKVSMNALILDLKSVL